jgi:hypothetical protein
VGLGDRLRALGLSLAGDPPRSRALVAGHAEALPLRGRYTITRRDGATGRVISRNVYHNVICVNGKIYLAQLLNAEVVTSPIWAAIGTGAGTPATGDSLLFAEVIAANVGRVALASTQRSFAVLTWDFFWTTAQGQPGGGSSVCTEAGVFLAGSIAINSGWLLSHVAISETKTVSETLTVEFTLTIGA